MIEMQFNELIQRLAELELLLRQELGYEINCDCAGPQNIAQLLAGLQFFCHELTRVGMQEGFLGDSIAPLDAALPSQRDLLL